MTLLGRFAFAATLLVLTACSNDDSGRRTPPTATGLDESFLDRKADPCKDFYQFACGAWLAQNKQVPGYSETRFEIGDDRHDIFFGDILRGDVTTSTNIDGATNYYNACLLMRQGSSDFAPAGALLRTVATMTTKDALPIVLAALHDAGVRAFFHANPYPDPADPTHRILWLDDGGWSLPTREIYGDPSVTSAYQDHANALAALYPAMPFDAAAAVALESRIATATPSPAELQVPLTYYNRTSTADLGARVPSFDWAGYFQRSGFGAPETLNVVDPDYFTELESILSDSSVDALRSYLTLRVFEATANAASRSGVDEEFRFHGGVLFGRSKPQPDDYACEQQTRALFGNSLAKALVERYLPAGSVSAATKLADGVRRALRRDLGNVAWLDDGTRARALGKIDALLAKIGYPKSWNFDYEPEVSNRASYAQAWVDISEFLRRRAVRDLMDPVDRTAWTLSPSVTNATYSPLANSITIPVAVLEDPFFSVSWATAPSYGALGSLLGHEMTHGFDDGGRHFDESGVLTNWWSDTVDAEFHTRASCLVDQYGAYEPLPGLHIDGQLTLDENIADLGGLKLAHAAFESSSTHTSPSGSFDPEQAFFLSYAQLWCTNRSKSTLEDLVATDPHSPEKFRVNGVVRNVPEFAKAFACPRGAPLAPADRCDIW